MELKLIVLAGAKEGTQIPLKKDEFVIGRASECTLRAGSGAISRRHCAIVRDGDSWVARDLGSRNGTFLNDQSIEAPTALKVGDELRVGPLKFRVDAAVKKSDDSKAPKAAAQDTVSGDEAPPPSNGSNGSPDINRAKRSPAKDVADVAERTSNASGATSEEDISRWLLGTDAAIGDVTHETQTLSLEDTTAIRRAASNNSAVGAAAEADSDTVAGDDESESVTEETSAEATEESGSGWKLLGFGKRSSKSKKKPGKLPPRPADNAKDSREAAADILREMTRRR